MNQQKSPVLTTCISIEALDIFERILDVLVLDSTDSWQLRQKVLLEK